MSTTPNQNPDVPMLDTIDLTEEAVKKKKPNRGTFFSDLYGRLLINKSDVFVSFSRELSSRGVAFLIAIILSFGQALHNHWSLNLIAFGEGWIKTATTISFAIGISMSLVYFTLINDKKNSKGSIINFFYFFEVGSNMFYYLSKIIWLPWKASNLGFMEFMSTEAQLNHLLFALVVGFSVPFIIKKFANEIRAQELAPALNDDDFVTASEIAQLKETVNNNMVMVQEFLNKSMDKIATFNTLSDEMTLKFEEMAKTQLGLFEETTKQQAEQLQGLSEQLQSETTEQLKVLHTESKEQLESILVASNEQLDTFRSEYLDGVVEGLEGLKNDVSTNLKLVSANSELMRTNSELISANSDSIKIVPTLQQAVIENDHETNEKIVELHEMIVGLDLAIGSNERAVKVILAASQDQSDGIFEASEDIREEINGMVAHVTELSKDYYENKRVNDTAINEAMKAINEKISQFPDQQNDNLETIKKYVNTMFETLSSEKIEEAFANSATEFIKYNQKLMLRKKDGKMIHVNIIKGKA